MPSQAYDVAEIPPPRQPKPKRVNRILGEYTLSKTLGAGSMGKVKLATHNVSGEKLAVKILPRARVVSQSSKEVGKEVRTLREAGLSLLLHHPHICGMREMIVHPNHYYMVFEYVNGGQLLDFIIAHGRLRERVARKFARQIASALDYCHRNNVVHRDLKIENILISQTGNIKIIDFGLSNLYDPASHLSTFCGSLYFAAPELLNAKLYTGPEVDIWSFGVVLYTLLCGKVPFEDESMPALHAKIKRGLVEYPAWLSVECKHLLSRMLVINPLRRALLSEIFSHPWMLLGYPAPPVSHLPPRTPLRAVDIDPNVVARMAGFDFGADVEEVLAKLRDVLESDDYAAAVLAYEHRRNGHVAAPEPPSPPVSPAPPASPHPSDTAKRRRFSGFELYRRIFTSTPPPSPGAAAPPPPPPPRDPTGGFHPLVSMYFLAREKIEREEVYGAGVFASSQVSLDATPEKEDVQQSEVVTYEREREGGQEAQPAVPMLSVSTPEPTHVVDRGERLSETPHMNGTANGSAHIDEAKLVVDTTTPGSMMNTVLVQSPLAETAPVAAVEAAAQPTSRPDDAPPAFEPPTTLPAAEADEEGRLPTSPVVAKEKEQPALPVAVGDTKPEADTHKEEERARKRRDRGQTLSGGTTLLRKFGSILTGRHEGAGTVKRRDASKRASILGGAVLLSPVPADAERRSAEPPTEKKPIADLAPVVAATPTPAPEPAPAPAPAVTPTSPPASPVSQKEGQAFGSVRRRAATILDPATRASRHERRSSTGATLMTGTMGRRTRRRSTVGHDTATMSKADRSMFPKSVPEDETSERGEELSEDGARDGHVDSENERYLGEKEPKPVFLKGLLSVATTSTKSPPIIKADIRRVLDRMQVRYWQNKTGFECVHLPSIDAATSSTPTPNPHALQSFPSSGETTVAPSRNGITRRVTRLSFSVRRVKSQDREFATLKARNAEAARPLSTIVMPPSSELPHQPLVVPDAPPLKNTKPASVISANSKLLSSMASDLGDAPMSPLYDPHASGELDREAFENMAHNALSVRFEINIVKVPLLPLHGIQFRRSGGDGWQYQMLARRVLTELKL
ncbi:hypothetical protein DFH07DRAFT_990242 [Mycena maculata]|uniref:non-specific serine/threonine protein kinase n=1 Tax=Mycena maculata TaxID=230809 RepID=A0AAD7NSF8_9AGAR|nr:hypothetical protein DFH07DRAFT_990242 [Mycena maculata]